MFNLAHGLATWLFRSPGSQLARRPPPASAALSLATNARRERAAGGPPRGLGTGRGALARRLQKQRRACAAKRICHTMMRCGARFGNLPRTAGNKDGMMLDLAGSDHDEAPPQTPAARSNAQAATPWAGQKVPLKGRHD